MFVTYINTELKHNLKNGTINRDGSNLRALLMPISYEELDEDLFIPSNELLLDLNVSIFEYENTLLTFILVFYTSCKFTYYNNNYYNCVTEFVMIERTTLFVQILNLKFNFVYLVLIIF